MFIKSVTNCSGPPMIYYIS